MTERTLMLIKPDAVKKGLSDTILWRFQEDGFRVVATKLLEPTVEIIESHYYKVFSEHPEYRLSVVEYLTSGVLTAVILERENAVQRARQLIGPLTNAPAGTIRGDFRTDQSDPLNSLVHGSDSLQAAEEEIKIWFAEFIEKAGTTRRDFNYQALLAGIGFSILGGATFTKGGYMDMRQERELLFAKAIACHKNGKYAEARQYAQQCLNLLIGVESLEESATAEISVQAEGHDVLLPNRLLTETALPRFRSVGIQI